MEVDHLHASGQSQGDGPWNGTRQRESERNRLVGVYLTDAGRENERAITEQFLKLEGTIFENISADDRRRMRTLLQQLLLN